MAVVNQVLQESIETATGFRAKEQALAFEADFTDLCNTEHAVAFNGAGGAIDLVLRALDLGKDDEVVSCSLNFIGTHLAVIGSGANLVLAEPDPRTINLSPADLEKRLTENTKAVLITYMNGLAADIEQVNQVIKARYPQGQRPKVIVDAARALGTTYQGEHIGAEAWATIFSFQSKKMITSLGEGGMVVTDDGQLADLLRQYRSFGKNKGWGSNYKMTKIQAAVCRVQLRRLPELVARRRELAAARNQAFSSIEGLSIQADTAYSQNSYYLYTMVLPPGFTAERRDKLMEELDRQYQIGTVVGNPPTYNSNPLIAENVVGQELPIAESVGDRIICLPSHPLMKPETNQYIIDAFLATYQQV